MDAIVRDVERQAKGIKIVILFVLGIIFWLLMLKVCSAGVDFSYLGPASFELKRATQQYISNVQDKNKDKATIAYERIKEILREMPDSSRNSSLLAEYFEIIERIRKEGEASLADRKRLSELTNSEGAYIETRSEVIKEKKEK